MLVSIFLLPNAITCWILSRFTASTAPHLLNTVKVMNFAFIYRGKGRTASRNNKDNNSNIKCNENKNNKNKNKNKNKNSSSSSSAKTPRIEEKKRGSLNKIMK